MERKKTRKTARLWAALLCVLVLLSACGSPPAMEVPRPEPMPAPAGLRIAVASDLHLNPDNTHKSAESGADAYNLELVDALLWDAKEQGAEILLLTGDLVNGGKPHRHEALAEKLRQTERTGLEIYVLPGNHDLAPIGQREFAELYADFGYQEAFSRDEASLSYCVKRGGLMILMMDTAGYPGDAIDLPGARKRADSEAFLSEKTLLWAEEMLSLAREEGLKVLCAGHYNLLSPESRQEGRSGYYVENGARFAALLQDYAVPLYCSGHTHIRTVWQEKGLTEQVTEYLLAYPTGYSILDVTEDALTLTPRRVDVDAWAKASGQTDPVLLDFARWQQERLRACADENVAYMAARNPISRREKRQAAEFFYAVMDAYWQGTLHERRTELEAMPGCEPFFHCAAGYAYEWWLKDLMESAGPMLAGFTLPI